MTNSLPPPDLCDINVKDLSFRYNAHNPLTLKNISFYLPPGSRTLLLGGNGSGKSTLLRLLSGRHMSTEGTVDVCGKNAYRATELNFWRSYLSCDWGMSTVAFGASR